MTSDVKLLPLPDKVEVDKHLPTGVRIYAYDADTLRTYARANIEHHTATKDAALEALRAELEVIVAEAVKYADKSGRLEAKVDRLAEALQLARDLVEDWAGYASEHFQKKHNLEGDLALLDDALRDHEQEAGNWTCEMRPNSQ